MRRVGGGGGGGGGWCFPGMMYQGEHNVSGHERKLFRYVQ